MKFADSEAALKNQIAGRVNEGDTMLVDHQGKSVVFVARPAPAEAVEAVEAEVV